VFAVAFFVISAAAPLTAMAGGAPVAMLLGNGPGIPLAYVVVSLILLIFAVGYTAMARHHTSTGAFYSFVSRGLRQPAGGAAAMIALLGYNAMQIGLYGLFAAAAAGFFSDNLGITLPWWVYALIAMAIIAVLGYRQVDLSVKVLAILVSLEFLIVLILNAAILIKGGQGGTAPLTLAPFTWASFTSGSVAIALLFNFASFIGFEATTIYSEEARDPQRTVPRATCSSQAFSQPYRRFTTPWRATCTLSGARGWFRLSSDVRTSSTSARMWAPSTSRSSPLSWSSSS